MFSLQNLEEKGKLVQQSLQYRLPEKYMKESGKNTHRLSSDISVCNRLHAARVRCVFFSGGALFAPAAPIRQRKLEVILVAGGEECTRICVWPCVRLMMAIALRLGGKASTWRRHGASKGSSGPLASSAEEG